MLTRLLKFLSVPLVIILFIPLLVTFGIIWVITGEFDPINLFKIYNDWITND